MSPVKPLPLKEAYTKFWKDHQLMPGKEVDLAFVKSMMSTFTYPAPKIAAFVQKHSLYGKTEPKYGKKLVKMVKTMPEYQQKREAYLHSFYPQNPDNIMHL